MVTAPPMLKMTRQVGLSNNLNILRRLKASSNNTLRPCLTVGSFFWDSNLIGTVLKV